MTGGTEFRQLGYRLLLFCLLVFILDLVAGKTLAHFYFTQQSGLYYRTTYAIDSTQADVLVFGSSRANHHYKPALFEEKLNHSFYNAGRDGNFILYHYAVLKSVLKRYTPKIVLLDLNNREFESGPQSYDRLSCLLPYYKQHPELRPIVQLRSVAERLKLVSQIYPYNSLLLSIAIGNTKANKMRKQDDKGYVALHESLDQAPKAGSAGISYSMDAVKEKCYRAFIEDCQAAGVRVYVICSPCFNTSFSNDPSVLQAKKIAEEKQVPFHDFSGDTAFLNHPGLFADTEHLNDSGATIYSGRVADLVHHTYFKTALCQLRQ